ncbi:MAG TPA: hypothetical protein DCP47_04260 [Phycisphaerales bacterium]|nr:hypothetical protein [Phycisphaerales bacterium]
MIIWSKESVRFISAQETTKPKCYKFKKRRGRDSFGLSALQGNASLLSNSLECCAFRVLISP